MEELHTPPHALGDNGEVARDGDADRLVELTRGGSEAAELTHKGAALGREALYAVIVRVGHQHRCRRMAWRREWQAATEPICGPCVLTGSGSLPCDACACVVQRARTNAGMQARRRAGMEL